MYYSVILYRLAHFHIYYTVYMPIKPYNTVEDENHQQCLYKVQLFVEGKYNKYFECLSSYKVSCLFEIEWNIEWSIWKKKKKMGVNRIKTQDLIGLN